MRPYFWILLFEPENSQATISDTEQPEISFIPDVPGKCQFVNRVTIGHEVVQDLIDLFVFEVTEVSDNYHNLLPGANGSIHKITTYKNQLCITGTFNEIGGVPSNQIACFNGNNWEPLGNGLVEGRIRDMMEYRGELYLTCQFSEIGPWRYIKMGCMLEAFLTRWWAHRLTVC